MIGDDEDEIPLDHMIALRSGLPDAQLAVVPAAGHGPPLDRPELFTLLVTEFVTMAGRSPDATKIAASRAFPVIKPR